MDVTGPTVRSAISVGEQEELAMNVSKMFCIGVLAAIAIAFALRPAVAQRGMGDWSGAARMPVRPEIVTLSGKLIAINVGPCEKTTGRAKIGVHLIVEPTVQSSDGAAETTKPDPLNVHVGPAAMAQEMVNKFPIGTQLTIAAFRTDKMPANQYVAQSIKSNTTTVTLRDESLRPAWADARGSDGSGIRGRGPVFGYRQANCPRQQMMR